MILTNYEFKKQHCFFLINRIINIINWFWLAIVLITNLVIIGFQFANVKQEFWLNYFNLGLLLSSFLVNIILTCCLIFNKFDKTNLFLMEKMLWHNKRNELWTIRYYLWHHLHYRWVFLSGLILMIISCFSFGFFPWFKTIEPIALSNLILSTFNMIWTIVNGHLYIIKYWIK